MEFRYILEMNKMLREFNSSMEKYYAANTVGDVQIMKSSLNDAYAYLQKAEAMGIDVCPGKKKYIENKLNMIPDMDALISEDAEYRKLGHREHLGEFETDVHVPYMGLSDKALAKKIKKQE